MKLLSLEKGKFHITAYVDESGDEDCCPITEFLEEAEGSNYEKHANGLMVLLERFAEHGHEIFNDKQCHYIDKNNKIWQLRKGSLRLLWFYGGKNRVIVCSHAFIKKSQKTPPKEKAKAIKLKSDFESLTVDPAIIEE